MPKKIESKKNLLEDLFKNYGLPSFNDEQTLEYIMELELTKLDGKKMAMLLTEKFGGLDGVLEAHPDRLSEIEGLDDKWAHFISFLKQFVTYYQVLQQKDQTRIRNTKDAIKYLHGIMKTYSAEQFVLLCLDMNGRIIHRTAVTDNDMGKVHINIREITDAVLRIKSTASVVIAHNHISDTVQPSNADINLTRALVNTFKNVSVYLKDHIIFGKNGQTYSFEESKLLPSFREEYKGFLSGSDYEEYWAEALKKK